MMWRSLAAQSFPDKLHTAVFHGGYGACQRPRPRMPATVARIQTPDSQLLGAVGIVGNPFLSLGIMARWCRDSQVLRGGVPGGGGLAISKACMNDGKQGITPDASLAGGDCRKQQEKTRMEMQRDNKHC